MVTCGQKYVNYFLTFFVILFLPMAKNKQRTLKCKNLSISLFSSLPMNIYLLFLTKLILLMVTSVPLNVFPPRLIVRAQLESAAGAFITVS